MTMKLVIAGYYGFANAGDEAILSGMIHDLKTAIPDVEICVVSANPVDTQSQHGVNVIDMEHIPDLIEKIRSSDAVLLGGGGLLHDYWALREEYLLTPKHIGLAYYVGIILLAYLLDRPVMLYSVGVGPLQDVDTIEVIRWAISMITCISVRDPESAALLQSLKIEGNEYLQNVPVAADPAFNMKLTPSKDALKVLTEIGIPLEKSLLGVNLRHWEYDVDPSSWQEEVAICLDTWIEENDGHIVFLPLQVLPGTVYENDLLVSERVIEKLRNKDQTEIVNFSKQWAHLPGIISHCDVFLSMRLHGIIFSLLAGTPITSMAYDPKVSQMMKMVGANELNLQPNNWTSDQLLKVLNKAPAAFPHASVSSTLTEMRVSARKSASLVGEIIAKKSPTESPVDLRIKKLTVQKVQEAYMLRGLSNFWENRSYDLADLFVLLQERYLELEKARTTLRRQVKQLDIEISHDKVEVQRLRRQIDLFEEGQSYLEDQLTATKKDREEINSRLRQIETMRDHLIIERDDALRQLDNLRDTLAVRILAKYWEFARRLFPVGSKRRSLYLRIRPWLRKWIHRPYTISERDVGSYASRSIQVDLEDGETTESAHGYEQKLQSSMIHFADHQYQMGHRKVVTIVSPTEFNETEGQRAIHLAKEFAKKNWAIVFAYWRWDLLTQRHQDQLKDNIFLVPMDEIISNPDNLINAFSLYEEALVLIEFPYPGLFEMLSIAHGAGWLVAYDVVDDWNAFHSVGQATWYEDTFERHLVRSSDLVLVINDRLASLVGSMGRENPSVVPNGVNPLITKLDSPIELLKGEVTLGYFGYLTPAWFNWDLLRDLGSRHPDWLIYLIGYGDEGETEKVPSNIIFLGKQPWTSLAAYAANWDVALVPFKIGSVAKAADPIKTYEYLCLGLPVVAMGVDPPKGSEDYVFQSNSVSEFITNIESARNWSEDRVKGAKAFAELSTWSNRANQILELIEAGDQRIIEKRSLF
jgi:polysaccharide pyruvyl transferase CsaB